MSRNVAGGKKNDNSCVVICNIWLILGSIVVY